MNQSACFSTQAELGCSLGRDHLAGGHAQPHQDVHVLQAACGDRFHGDEIDRPECVGVPLDEVVPAVGRTIWAGLNAFLLQNVSDGLPTDFPDAELAQLADDAAVAETRGLGDLDD